MSCFGMSRKERNRDDEMRDVRCTDCHEAGVAPLRALIGQQPNCAECRTPMTLVPPINEEEGYVDPDVELLMHGG